MRRQDYLVRDITSYDDAPLPPIDNWNCFGYKQRYLDALASICHVQLGPKKSMSPVTAISENVYASISGFSKVFHLSYNNEPLQKSKNIVSNIERYINYWIKDSDTIFRGDKILVAIYIAATDFRGGALLRNHNVKRIDKLKEDIPGIDLTDYIKLQESIEELQSTTTSRISEINQVIYKSLTIFDQYMTVLNLISKTGDKALFDIAIRPYQDVTKVLHFLKSNVTHSIEIVPLSNPMGIHTECNVLMNSWDERYIGISRLCCTICDKF